MKRAATVALLLLLFGLAGCQSPQQVRADNNLAKEAARAVVADNPQAPRAEPCDSQVMSRVTLDKLYGKLDSDLNSASRKSEVTPERLHRQREKIACLREWIKTVKDGCQRAAFDHWMDYYEGAANDAEENMRGEGREGESKSYDEREREEDNRVRLYEQTHKVPTPEQRCYDSSETADLQ